MVRDERKWRRVDAIVTRESFSFHADRVEERKRDLWNGAGSVAASHPQ